MTLESIKPAAQTSTGSNWAAAVRLEYSEVNALYNISWHARLEFIQGAKEFPWRRVHSSIITPIKRARGPS